MGNSSIPIIRFREFLLVSIQVDLSDSVVLALKEDITRTIDRTGITGLVVDLTGIELMDSYISRVLRDIAVMARLMGVRTVLNGMQPPVAMTMVEMGMHFKDVSTSLELGEALDILRAGARADANDDVMVIDGSGVDDWH